MYLQPEEALGLIAECAKRFPGGQMMFDLPPACSPAWRSARHARVVAALPGAADAVHAVTVRRSQTSSTPFPASGPCMICPMAPGRGKVLNALIWTPAAGAAARHRSARHHPARIRLDRTRAFDVLDAQRLVLVDAERLAPPSRRCARRSPSPHPPDRSRATKVPKRPRVSRIPADSSSRYARATVLTAMPQLHRRAHAPSAAACPAAAARLGSRR